MAIYLGNGHSLVTGMCRDVWISDSWAKKYSDVSKKFKSQKIWHRIFSTFFSTWVQMSYWWKNKDVCMYGWMVSIQIMLFQSRLWLLGLWLLRRWLVRRCFRGTWLLRTWFVGTWLLWTWLLRSYLEPGYTEPGAQHWW